MPFDPGQLRERVRFEARTAQTDEYGNAITGAFAPRFERAALYLMRPGSESVLAARLTGRQPVTIVVRLDPDTATITQDWRAVDARDGTVWSIIAPPADMDRQRQWLTITAEAGVAS